MEVALSFAEIKPRPAPHFLDEDPFDWDCWVSKVDGSYICTVDDDWKLKFLINQGIVESVQNVDGNSSDPANIGFNPVEKKWYGWSHRTVHGFGIGSTCRKGDCHYYPKNEEDFIEAALAFWADDSQEDVAWIKATDDNGVEGIQMTYRWSQGIPNEKLRGTIGERFLPFPAEYGKGEWDAITIEDAKQMAIDFANKVS